MVVAYGHKLRATSPLKGHGIIASMMSSPMEKKRRAILCFLATSVAFLLLVRPIWINIAASSMPVRCSTAQNLLEVLPIVAAMSLKLSAQPLAT